MSATVVVQVEENRALTIKCSKGDYSINLEIEEIRRPFGPDQVGNGLLRVLWHVLHVENGVPEELLR